MTEVVCREQAEKEFSRWAFEIKRIKERLIDEDSKESFIQNVMDGTFEIAEDGAITHKLSCPLEARSELKYKPRMKVFEMSKMKACKDSDSTGKAAALLSVLSGENKGVIEKLDSLDFMAASQLVGFYLVG